MIRALTLFVLVALVVVPVHGQVIYSTSDARNVTMEAMVDALATDADVVFVGEEHDDPATHRLEAEIFAALHKKRAKAVLSLEMFERDTQSILDAYLAGSTPEKDFLAGSRPWPNYETDYKPLVEYAKANSLPVLASNVPRRVASKVSKGTGLSELGSLLPGEAQWVASDAFAPKDTYWMRFRGTMGGHGGVTDAVMYRIYEAQVVKDETMAESIARMWSRTAASRTLIVHYNGAFHSDFGLGTVARLRRRAPGAAVATISVMPVDDPAKANGALETGRADYVIYVVREPKK